MNDIKKFLTLLLALFIGHGYCLDPKVNEPTVPEMDVVSKIDLLQKKLITEDVPSVIQLCGYDGNVPSSFIISSSFYTDGVTISQFIVFVEKSLIALKRVSSKEDAADAKIRNEKVQLLRDCLSKMDEIIHLQFRLLIRNINIAGLINPQDWRQFHLDQSANAVGYSDEYAQTQLINTFSKIFSFGEEDGAFRSGARRIMIAVFRARNANSLNFAQKKESLSEMLESQKRQMNREYSNSSYTTKDNRPTKEEISGCIDLLNVIGIEKVQAFPFKKFATAILGALVTAGVSYAAYKIIYKIVSSPRLEHKVPDVAEALMKQFTSGEKGAFTQLLEHIVNERLKKGLPMINIGIPQSADTVLHHLATDPKGGFTKVMEGIATKMENRLPMIDIGIPKSADDILHHLVNDPKGGFTKVMEGIADRLEKNKKDGKDRPMFTVGVSLENVVSSVAWVCAIVVATWWAAHYA
jgi:hypothetical protein